MTNKRAGTPSELRAQLKVVHEAYREAARRLHPGAIVTPSVVPSVMPDGAYVEITVFVPRDLLVVVE